MSKYTTGEIAKLCGVSVRTVQYYDERGILIPSELSEGGRRLYSEDDYKKLKIICFLRDAGISIKSIGELLSESNPSSVISVLLEKQEQRKFCIFRMHNPSDAKKLGRDLTLRPDWEKVKVRLMYEICMCKFMQNPELRDKLLATGESTLIEGNNWGDYFWGKVNNCGENQLGIILMDVRAKLQWNAETAPNNIPQCLQ